MNDPINKHPEVSSEERNLMAIETYAFLWALTFNSLVDRFGSTEALKMMEPVMRHFGTGGALLNRKRFGIEGHELKGIVECLDFIMDCMQVKAHIQTLNDDFCLWIIDKCPFENTSFEVCTAFDMMIEGHVQTHNQDFCSYHASMVTKGDRFCSLVVEKKDPSSEMKCR